MLYLRCLNKLNLEKLEKYLNKHVTVSFPFGSPPVQDKSVVVLTPVAPFAGEGFDGSYGASFGVPINAI